MGTYQSTLHHGGKRIMFCRLHTTHPTATQTILLHHTCQHKEIMCWQQVTLTMADSDACKAITLDDYSSMSASCQEKYIETNNVKGKMI
jgi:hypothetical protein